MVILGLAAARAVPYKKRHDRKRTTSLHSDQQESERPRNEKKNEMQQFRDQEKEKLKEARVVRIRVFDPYATDSSTDEETAEEEEATEAKRKIGNHITYVAQIPYDDYHASCLASNDEEQGKDQSFRWKALPELASKSPSLSEKHQEKERRTIKRSKRVYKSNFEFTSYRTVKDGKREELVLECHYITCPELGLCDVPGPVPDNLDGLMRDATLPFNFFEDLPDD